MGTSNRELVDKGLQLLREGVTPFACQQFESILGCQWIHEINRELNNKVKFNGNGYPEWDNYALLKVMDIYWKEVFSQVLGKMERSWLNELREVRNRFAHEQHFSSDDAYRGLDTMQRMLQSVSAGDHAAMVAKLKEMVLRTRMTNQARDLKRTTALSGNGERSDGLQPWRFIIEPHPDVSSGRYQLAEFAADLAQVHRGEATSEYQDPKEFYKRTHLTGGLKDLLKNSILRLSGQGGEPVIELQTNFGGGKTHSMLALFHLFSGVVPADLSGVESLLEEFNISEFPKKVNRAVIVGQALSPGQPHTKPDGTQIRTLWGEVAWQLGGKEGYSLIEESDKNGTSPGTQVLSQLFKRYSPALILVDEWIAYIRQTYTNHHLPAGSFDANITFAQVLTEAAKAAPNTLVVATLPSSRQDEVGGEGGRKALDALKNVFGRVQSSWRPAKEDESYEIIRRRLFNPIEDKAKFAARDAIINTFHKLYTDHKEDFPSICKELEYKERLKTCYPVHPELFERLYSDWSTLEKFQQTRGVLRLMASVIHALWESGDKELLIMPSMLPIDDRTVHDGLTHYLEDAWKAVIDRDIDGDKALPTNIDRSVNNLGKLKATRRVARTVFMGSAPLAGTNNRGLEENKVLLGCVQPSEPIEQFRDALNRLANDATYLYKEGKRYWYSTQPSVTRLARDRAVLVTQEDIHSKLHELLRAEARKRGEFSGVHLYLTANDEIPDEKEARLVLFGPEFTHHKESKDSAGFKQTQAVLNQRGNAPRIYKNALVFLLPDQNNIVELEECIRQYLAWDSICEDNTLDLTQSQKKNAQDRRSDIDKQILPKLQETWIWCLSPAQDINGSISPIHFEEFRLQGQENLAVKVSKKLTDIESLLTQYSAPRIKMDLDKYLWRGQPYISIKQLIEDYATHPYLSRLKDKSVLLKGIENNFTGLVFQNFGYATAFDETKKKYIGLVTSGVNIKGHVIEQTGLLVHEDAVIRYERELLEQQVETQNKSLAHATTSGASSVSAKTPKGTDVNCPIDEIPAKVTQTQFFASVTLDEHRVGRDAGRIAEEVIQHLTTDLKGANIIVTLEIHGEFPEGIPDDVVRTVTENCNALKFKHHKFE